MKRLAFASLVLLAASLATVQAFSQDPYRWHSREVARQNSATNAYIGGIMSHRQPYPSYAPSISQTYGYGPFGPYRYSSYNLGGGVYTGYGFSPYFGPFGSTTYNYGGWGGGY